MRSRYTLSAVWLLLFFVIGAGFHHMYTLRAERRVAERLAVLDSRIEATVKTLGSFSRYVFETAVERDDVLRLVAQAWDTSPEHRNELRQDLYSLLRPVYEQMQEYDFRQLHFHFPNTASFLRMHAPERYGDHLGNIRHSVLAANIERRPSQGFEEGRVFNGYRFVYPLFYQEQHIGSAEVSFSIQSFLDVLGGLTDSRYLFAIRRSVVHSTVFREFLRNYEESYVSPELMFDAAVASWPEFEPLFAERQAWLQRQLARNESFGYFGRLEDQDYLVLMHAVRNVRGLPVGYIIAVTPDATRQDQRWDRVMTGILLVIGFVIIEVLTWILVRDRQQLKRLARTDQLTGILNRYWFHELSDREIEAARRYGHPLSLIIFDVDHFKQVNDTYGHNVGDEVLKQLVGVVQGEIRASDVLARWGGEEFVVLLPHADAAAAGQAAEKLRAAVESADVGADGGVTISLGVAELGSEESLDAMIGRADRALYRAKQSGRNRSCLADSR
ncbi:sensor domain-containing diguanylate cyclase [Spirochaeta africana]|uniref:diguanylate cyclase n=1 Tax=Spirochaeta africana (strain ATCC 700263 / DSM 8902 / Z-7692) TaxID=889378 RepID=H9UGA6_SPIAZ|nr:diguanylate cyclase [Spirochaeta africana]AFG36549.1 diguanylate cyclase (GGDEF) domain-containing protein [Spirochaeta africana DSM 8902]